LLICQFSPIFAPVLTQIKEMKKAFYSLIAIAVTLVTFTACSSDGGDN